jgi:hypothetical protein
VAIEKQTDTYILTIYPKNKEVKMTKYKKVLQVILLVSVLLVVVINTAQAYWIIRKVVDHTNTRCNGNTGCGIWGEHPVEEQVVWRWEQCWDDGTHCTTLGYEEGDWHFAGYCASC